MKQSLLFDAMSGSGISRAMAVLRMDASRDFAACRNTARQNNAASSGLSHSASEKDSACSFGSKCKKSSPVTYTKLKLRKSKAAGEPKKKTNRDMERNDEIIANYESRLEKRAEEVPMKSKSSKKKKSEGFLLP